VSEHIVHSIVGAESYRRVFRIGRAANDRGRGWLLWASFVRLTTISLGAEPIALCLAGDADQDGRITVDEEIRAVKHALDRCPAS
jgi:hypothetical protein